MEMKTGDYSHRVLRTTVGGILTYEGSSVDIVLNYLAFVVTFVTLAYMLMSVPQGKITWQRYFWVHLTIGLFAFQIGLCLGAECSGISVVWSANCGFMWYILWIFRRKGLYLVRDSSGVVVAVSASSALAVTLWSYYAVVDAMLTTVAHICAIIMGVIIAWLFAKCIRTSQQGCVPEGVEADKLLVDCDRPNY